MSFMPKQFCPHSEFDPSALSPRLWAKPAATATNLSLGARGPHRVSPRAHSHRPQARRPAPRPKPRAAAPARRPPRARRRARSSVFQARDTAQLQNLFCCEATAVSPGHWQGTGCALATLALRSSDPPGPTSHLLQSCAGAAPGLSPLWRPSCHSTAPSGAYLTSGRHQIRQGKCTFRTRYVRRIHSCHPT